MVFYLNQQTRITIAIEKSNFDNSSAESNDSNTNRFPVSDGNRRTSLSSYSASLNQNLPHITVNIKLG